MNTEVSPIGTICATLILIAILGGVFTLAWHGTFSGAEVFGIVTTIIGIAGGAIGVHSGVRAAGKNAVLHQQVAAARARPLPREE